MREILRRSTHSPLVHFLVLGGLIQFGVALTTDDRPVLSVSSDRIAQAFADWHRAHGAAPPERARTAIVEALVDEAVLVETARALGLDEAPAVIDRLAKLGRFLELVPPKATSAEAEAAARSLGLDLSDPVVRRYLARVGRLVVVGEAPARFTEADLVAYFEAHREAFRREARYRLWHVYVADDSDSGRARADALLKVGVGDMPPSRAIAHGDRFFAGHVFAGIPAGRIAGEFGRRFADAIVAGPRESWQGPVRSAYGWHLVYLVETEPARVPTLAEVRDEVEAALVQARQAAVLKARIAELKSTYRVEVALPEALARG